MQIQEAASLIQQNPDLQNKLQADPMGTLNTMAAMPLQTDVWIYRVVVASLGAVALVAIVGGIMLAFYAKPTPEGVIALGATAIGAIAGLLAQSPSRK